jgi:hypothetical protein
MVLRIRPPEARSARSAWAKSPHSGLLSRSAQELLDLEMSGGPEALAKFKDKELV